MCTVVRPYLAATSGSPWGPSGYSPGRGGVENKHSTDVAFGRTESPRRLYSVRMGTDPAGKLASHAAIWVRVLVLNDPPAWRLNSNWSEQVNMLYVAVTRAKIGRAQKLCAGHNVATYSCHVRKFTLDPRFLDCS